MGKRFVKIWDLPSSSVSGVLLILSSAFFLGGLAGCLLTNQVVSSGGDALSEYLEGYLSMAYSGDAVKPAILSLLWETIRWQLLTVFLGVTPLGLLGIPFLFLVRGFLFSFALASFFRALGVTGLALAFVLFGITGLIGIPVLFVLGVQGFLSAGTMAGRLLGEAPRLSIFNRMNFIRSGVCAFALCICALLEYYVIPILLGSLADMLSLI